MFHHVSRSEEEDFFVDEYGRQAGRKFTNPEVERQTPQLNRYFNPWSILGLTTIVVAACLLIIGLSKSGEDASQRKPASAAAQVVKKLPSAVAKSTHKYSTEFRKAVKTAFAKMSQAEHMQLFEAFKRLHNKRYATAKEEETRFAHFQSFLERVDQHNEAEEAVQGTAKHGITKFADLTEEEFRQHFLNAKPSAAKSADKEESDLKKGIYTVPQQQQQQQSAKKGFGKDGRTAATDAIQSVDWSGVYTTEVRDQGYCGSCWAFSATEQLESDAIRAGLLTTQDMLAAQQVVSCDPVDFGCDGGFVESAYIYVARAGGLPSEAAYPYSSYYGQTGTCDTSSSKPVLKITGYYSLHGEEEMMSYMLTTGPLAICLDASNWATYTSGILSSCGTEVNHCVQAVGVDKSAGFWKIRNSWGTSWGDQGYIYLKYGANTCNLTYDPTFTAVALA